MSRENREPDFARQIVSTVAACWGFTNPEFVRWFDNVVYRVAHRGANYYLRLTPASRRTKAQIESELDVLRFLAARSIPAARPVASQTGDNVLLFEGLGLEGLEAQLIACVFTECPGQAFQRHPPADLGAFWLAAGSAMGRLHRELKQFSRPSSFTRMAWSEERWDRFSEVVPATETEAWLLYEELREWWGSLNRSNNFGLIHGDFTIKNLHYDDNRISLFDFDCCCEHWFGYELACFLHFFSDYPVAQRRLAYDQTLEGYARTAAVSQELIEQIPLFGKMKLLRGFFVYATEWGLRDLPPDQQGHFNPRRQRLAAPPVWPAA